MKKIMFYCQHVLGIGHIMRSMALVQGLKDFQVCFVSGGEMVPGLEFPPTVSVVHLPPLKSDAHFQQIETVGGQSLAETEAARTQRVLDEFERFQPDALIIELFPFGRNKFRFELVPLLARIRAGGRRTRVICSLRDILVSRSDQDKYEARVVGLMQRYFDALLVHADPHFQRLEETFKRVADLGMPVIYTGYVAQAAPPLADEPDAQEAKNRVPLILVSIGGGRVGYELVSAAIAASAVLLKDLPHQMLIFTGPFLPTGQFSQLQEMVADQPQITLRSYTNRFLAYMKRADLSISMAGYNTCMNILSAGVRALVLPFSGGGNDEQTVRARKLAELGLVGILGPETLQPQVLASQMRQRLHMSRAAVTLDMRGVEKTAAFLNRLLEETPNSTSSRHPDIPVSSFRAKLDQLQAEERPVHLFMRDDDVDEDEDSLRHLLDISLSRSVPLNLEVIPGRLTDQAIGLLKEHKRSGPALLEINQHGWLHVNHEATGRKCEFGPSRTLAQQVADIAQGRARLEKAFRARFYPVFTPPWNRCTHITFSALDQLGFAVLSKDQGAQPVTGYRFREISVTLDLFHWHGGPRLKSPDEIIGAIIPQMGTHDRIGLMLHHKLMDALAFEFLDQLLAELLRYPIVHFHTFQSLNQMLEQALMQEATSLASAEKFHEAKMYH